MLLLSDHFLLRVAPGCCHLEDHLEVYFANHFVGECQIHALLSHLRDVVTHINKAADGDVNLSYSLVSLCKLVKVPEHKDKPFVLEDVNVVDRSVHLRHFFLFPTKFNQ